MARSLGEGVGQDRHMPLSSHASPIDACIASPVLPPLGSADATYPFPHLGCLCFTHPVRPSISGGRPGG
jgi:hypothetical protein